MTALPRVSIVVPVRNAEATLGDMLQGLVHQATPESAEILIVDNGSSDRSREIAESFPVKVLIETKLGPAAARNLGLRAARGEIIAHLDADTLPTRNWLRELLGAFDDPDTVIAAGRSISYAPETAPERYVEASGRLDVETSRRRHPFPFAPSKNLAVRRTAAIRIGGWCEDMLTGEDVDFCFRILREFPGEIAYRERAIVFHRNRQTDAALRVQAWTYGEGAAQLYRRYPEVADWNLHGRVNALRILATRGLSAAYHRAAFRVGLCSESQCEFARYHALWSWWWWRGFFSWYRSGERVSPPAHPRGRTAGVQC